MRRTLASALAAAVALPAQALEDGACFARTYSEAHLAAHPSQTVRRLSVVFGRRPGEETAEAVVEVVFRDRADAFSQWLFCYPAEPELGEVLDVPKDAMRCGVDCDGGIFYGWMRGADTLMMESHGFVVAGGCGEPRENGEAPESRFVEDVGAETTLYRLVRAERAACWQAPE